MDTPEEKIDNAIGGVQGTEEDHADASEDLAADPSGDGQTVKAPDAGEIEWAGGLIELAPRSS